MEKIYAVEFISYTNCLKNTVSDWDGKGIPKVGEQEYLTVGHNFLVRESELEKYRKFGQGYRSITFVGELLIEDE